MPDPFAMTTMPKPNWNRWTPNPHDPLQVRQRIEKDKKNQPERARKNKTNQEALTALGQPADSTEHLSSSSLVEEQVRKLQTAVGSTEPSSSTSASASTTDPPVVYLGMVSDDVFKVLTLEPETYEGKSMLVFPSSAYQAHLFAFGKRMIQGGGMGGAPLDSHEKLCCNMCVKRSHQSFEKAK